MKKIILVGGTYGSGKSTTAKEIADSYFNPYTTDIIDSDMFIGNGMGKTVDVENSDELRRKAWNELMLPAINTSLQDHELVIVPGAFYTRERRERFINVLSDFADVTALFYMLPMRETIDRIRRDRTDETHLVNHTRYRDFYRKFNQHFREDNQSDLLLPHNREKLAPEYLALLTKQESNKHIVLTPQLDKTRPHHWIVIPEPLRIETFISAIQKGIHKPHEMRQALGYGYQDRKPVGFYR